MYEYKAKTISVVDGDTFNFEFSMGLNVYVKERVRLANCDTPEVYGRAVVNEKDHGRLASNFVKSVLEDNQRVVVRTGIDKEKKGKYGRWIARVFIPFEDVVSMFNTEDVDISKITKTTYVDLGALLHARNLFKWPAEAYRAADFQKKFSKVEKNLEKPLSWKIVESQLLVDIALDGLIGQ